MGWWGWPRLAALIADHCLWSPCLHNFHRGEVIMLPALTGAARSSAGCHRLRVVISCEWRLREWRRVTELWQYREWHLRADKIINSERHYYLKQASAKVHQGSAHISASRLVFSSHLSTKISKYPAGGIYLSPVLYLFSGLQLIAVSFPWEFRCVLKRLGLHYWTVQSLKQKSEVVWQRVIQVWIFSQAARAQCCNNRVSVFG